MTDLTNNPTSPDDLSDDDFLKLRELVHRLTGISLADTKRQLVRSRLQRIMRRDGYASFREFHDKVASQGPSSDLARQFINAMTTNKTDFFREPHHFDFVATRVLEVLRTSSEHRLKIWHAGCSTGEEVYTLAITLLEARKQMPDLRFVQLASDIDTDVLAHAERGIYDEERVSTISDALLRRWFLRGKGEQTGKYRVRPELQEQVQFKRINLLDEPWPMQETTRFDLIFCRNVLIYFDKQTQKRLHERFCSRLKPGGFLFLGHSESIQGVESGLTSIGRTIYQAPKDQSKELPAA